MLLIITIPPLWLPLARSTLWWNRVRLDKRSRCMHPQMKKVCFRADKRHMGHDPQYDVSPRPSSHSDIFSLGFTSGLGKPLRSFPPHLLYWSPYYINVSVKKRSKKKTITKKLKEFYLRILTKPGFLRTKPLL